MKQGEAVRAYKSLVDLNKQKLSSGILARKVFLLLKALQTAWDFQIQEEQKVFDSHPIYDPSVNGVKLPKEEPARSEALAEANAINEELRKIDDMDVDIEFEKFDFDLNKESIQISGEDIGNLESFINFI